MLKRGITEIRLSRDYLGVLKGTVLTLTDWPNSVFGIERNQNPNRYRGVTVPKFKGDPLNSISGLTEEDFESID